MRVFITGASGFSGRALYDRYVPYREFFAPYAQLVGRRLITLPAPVAIGTAAVAQRAARLAPGDNEINPGSARYLLRRGTYSNAKARSTLGWEPRVGIQDGVDRTIAWLRGQGSATDCYPVV